MSFHKNIVSCTEYHSQLICNKTISMEKEQSCQQMDTNVQKNKLKHLPHTLYKMEHRLNRRAKAVKLLQGNTQVSHLKKTTVI